MSYRESAFFFESQGEMLPGIVTTPMAEASVGVLVIVGGPQYRVGSHRLFVQLCRRMASQGLAAMRFDFRGMGDGTGEPVPFDAHGQDIAAALSAFRAAVPSMRQIVLLGLCDGATAAVLHAAVGRVADGLILLNPWTSVEEGVSRTVLKHYYASRLADKGLWKKLVSGQLGLSAASRQFVAWLGASIRSLGGEPHALPTALPARFAEAFGKTGSPALIVLSERDFVAREFEDCALVLPEFADALDAGRAELKRVSGADHTFSDPELADEMIRICLEWMTRRRFAQCDPEALQCS